MSKRQRGPLPSSTMTNLRHVIVQFANIRSKDTVLKAARAKKTLTYQGRYENYIRPVYTDME